MQNLNNKEKNRALAIFDFDGTITTRDSFLDFLYFSAGPLKFSWNFIAISPAIFLYFLKIIPNWKLKEKTLSQFFGGLPIDDFSKMCKNYSDKRLDKIIRSEAIKKIKWHKERGDEIIVASASLESWLGYWCGKNKLNLVATIPEIIDGKITGKLDSKNCYGEEKAKRIKSLYNLEDYADIYAYTDSKSDYPLLKLASFKYLKWRKI